MSEKIGGILRDVRLLGDGIYQVGVKAMNSSVEEKEQFLKSVEPHINKLQVLKRDKEALEEFLSLKDTPSKISFLSAYGARGARGNTPPPRSARGNTVPPRGSTPPPRGAKSARGAKVNKVLDKAREIREEIKNSEKKLRENKKLNALEAFSVAKKRKYDEVERFHLTVYTETEELVTDREIKYLKAKENIVELKKQIEVIKSDIKYYKFDNIKQEEVAKLENLLSQKLKELGSAKKDVEHFAPKTKKLLNYVGDVALLPFRTVKSLFIPPKPVELTAEQIVMLGVK